MPTGSALYIDAFVGAKNKYVIDCTVNGEGLHVSGAQRLEQLTWVYDDMLIAVSRCQGLLVPASS